jgi:hypothetical protein
MVEGDLINVVRKPVDHSIRGTSAWLRATSEAAAARESRGHEGE